MVSIKFRSVMDGRIRWGIGRFAASSRRFSFTRGPESANNLINL